LNQIFSEPTPEPSLVGRMFGARYLLSEVVAEGGMATVYRAKDVKSGQAVAVKVMHPHLTRDRGFAQRFRREALIAGRLSHPGVVRVMDYGSEGPLFFLVMELLSGEDLFDVLRRHRRLDATVARRVVIEVCDALVEPHAQGIVHRDLKPENVFLTRAGDGELRVKVLDFGVAKMMLPEDSSSGDSEPVLTAMGTLLGTPEYLSPEMCRGELVGPSADLYACGVLLYALLTGQPPFVTARPIDVTIKHVVELPRPPSEHLPGLDPALDAIILQALAKQPADRQPSARALADALRALGPAGPLSVTLLAERSTMEAVPRYSPESVTLAHAVTVSVPAGDDDHPVAPPSAPVVTPAPPPPPVLPGLVAAPTVAPAPVTSRPPATSPTTGGRAAVRWVLAAVVLLATFLAGVAVGRGWHAG
jgi:eukaryotic-like serine/threonine-protein kinase